MIIPFKNYKKCEQKKILIWALFEASHVSSHEDHWATALLFPGVKCCHRQQRPLITTCRYEAKSWCSQEKNKMLSSSSEAQVFENKHAAVPKPFLILKRRQSTNLWIGRPGTLVTNVISAWHSGFKPIQPPTHRPLLRLCHHNPQAGFLLPRWAGDSMCEQNSYARAARRNDYLFWAWQ